MTFLTFIYIISVHSLSIESTLTLADSSSFWWIFKQITKSPSSNGEREKKITSNSIRLRLYRRPDVHSTHKHTFINNHFCLRFVSSLQWIVCLLFYREKTFVWTCWQNCVFNKRPFLYEIILLSLLFEVDDYTMDERTLTPFLGYCYDGHFASFIMQITNNKLSH